ncbi:MAG: SBBP repeat-containing protein, partial [candidate division Zixibacteria bacterium]|nr:SBBP repeat-containing protein [candidate division Zixibacteria bacterium]
MLCRKGLTLTAFSLLMVSTLMATTTPNSSTTIQKMNQMPLAFTKNMGQWDDRVLFRANAGGATMWFTKEGVTYQFTRRIDTGSGAVSAPGLDSRFRGNDKVKGNDMEPDSVEQLVLTAKFLGANPNPEVFAEGLMEYKCNYFLGNDPSKWRTDVPNFEAVTLRDIYPGIDLKYSGDGIGQASYEFVVAPGADIAQIKVPYEGAEETSLDSDGRMVVTTKWGDMIAAIKSPTNGVLSGTGSFSQLSEKTIGFEADRSTRLTTDGASRQALGTLSVGLAYSTYLGGGNFDRGDGIAVDGSGYAYVTGYTYSSNFPTLNPYQTDQGYDDVFVTKLSSSGALIYSTYLGGGNGDGGFGIAVDGSGNAYVAGWTSSSNFPTLNPYQTDQGDVDVFVTKLSSTGNSLIYSTYLGGGSYDYGYGIAVDGSGNAYVTGLTVSSDFPTQNPYQGTFQGAYDVFVTKLSSSGNSLIYSTYLGGGSDELGDDIAVDDSGNAYVTGLTVSSDFPTQNPYQTTYQGAFDAFVTKLSSVGNSLIYSTYLGGGDYDYGNAIAVDGSGHAYVTGETSSTNFPTLNPYQTDQGAEDVFVTKLSSSGNSLIYSTYLGGGNYDVGWGIGVDGSGYAYVTGYTSSSDFPTLNPYQTDQGVEDVFVTKFSSSGNSLIYSTYLGGGDGDAGYGIAVDGGGYAYVTGWTGSSNFPTLNPYQPTYQGGVDDGDAFVTKLSGCAADADCDGIADGLDNCPNVPNPGQQDFDGDGVGNACDNCEDTDGDGFGNPGFFHNTCPKDNCPYVYNPAQEDFDGDGKGDSCDVGKVDFAATPRCGGAPLTVSFTDLSVPVKAITSWHWDFGDGHSSTEQNPIHEYTSSGAFNVQLVIADGGLADTLSRSGYITTQEGITADFIGVPNSGRSPLAVMFEPTLQGVANEYHWYFGDGDSSQLPNPIHVYTAQGKYNVTLAVRLQQDECDQVDTVTKNDFVVVQDLQPAFSATPVAGIEPLAVQFTDSSTGNPTSWFWDFGDGNSSPDQNPSHTYYSDSTYDVFLRVTNALGVDSLKKLSYIHVDSFYVDLEGQIMRRGWVQFRPGFSFELVFFWANLGTTPAANCELKVLLPQELVFSDINWIYSGTGTYSGYSFSGDTLVIPLQTIAPSGWYGGFVQAHGQIPETVPIGDTLICKSWLTTTSPENHLANSHVVTNLIVIGSWDPNDKIADPGGKELSFGVAPDQRINYTVQFENKEEATAEAIYVRVVDTLDTDLDWGTLSIGPMSHPDKCVASFDPYKGIITWFCDSIMLPPNVTPPEGEGYFTYSIKPKPNLSDGTEIANSAWIRFDYNPWLRAPKDGPIVRAITGPSLCGDANSDFAVDISDAVYLIAYIFSGGSAPSPLLA